MTHMLPAARRAVPVLTLAALLSSSITGAYAGNGAITGLRPVTVPNYSSSSGSTTANPTLPTNGDGTNGQWPQEQYPTGSSSSSSSSGSSSSGGSSGATSQNQWPSNSGSDSTFCTSLQNANNYSYAQSYANDQSTIQQPQSYSKCLGNILQQAQQISDMFTSGGLPSIMTIIQNFAQVAVKNIITGLENKVCKMVQSAANGVFGAFKKDFSQLSLGGSVVSIDATTSGATMTITPPDPLDFIPTPIVPAPPIVVPTPPAAPPTKPTSGIPPGKSTPVPTPTR